MCVCGTFFTIFGRISGIAFFKLALLAISTIYAWNNRQFVWIIALSFQFQRRKNVIQWKKETPKQTNIPCINHTSIDIAVLYSYYFRLMSLARCFLLVFFKDSVSLSLDLCLISVFSLFIFFFSAITIFLHISVTCLPSFASMY